MQKTLLGTSLFLAAFAKLGDHWNLEEQVILTLEEYVCCIFDSKKKSVDIVLAEMCMKKKAWKLSDWFIKYATMF